MLHAVDDIMTSSASRSSNSDSNSNCSGKNSSANTHLKQQVKMVAGELENVLDNLKAMGGDLRQLITQIDEVISKLDKEYIVLLDPETLDNAKRRLSTSVLETRPGRQDKCRMTGSHWFDLMEPGILRDCVSAAKTRDLSPSYSTSLRSSSSAYRRRMQRLLNPRSGHTFEDIDGCRTYSKTRNTRTSLSKPEFVSGARCERVKNLLVNERSAKELNHSQLGEATRMENENHNIDSRTSHPSFDQSSQRRFDHIPRAQELMEMRMTKSSSANEKPKLPVTNCIRQAQTKKHKHRLRSSVKCTSVEYLGVYEKELGSLLESDEIHQCDSFDEASSSIADDGDAFVMPRYNGDVNSWTTCTMVLIDTWGYSD